MVGRWTREQDQTSTTCWPSTYSTRPSWSFTMVFLAVCKMRLVLVSQHCPPHNPASPQQASLDA